MVNRLTSMDQGSSDCCKRALAGEGMYHTTRQRVVPVLHGQTTLRGGLTAAWLMQAPNPGRGERFCFYSKRPDWLGSLPNLLVNG